MKFERIIALIIMVRKGNLLFLRIFVEVGNLYPLLGKTKLYVKVTQTATLFVLVHDNRRILQELLIVSFPL